MQVTSPTVVKVLNALFQLHGRLFAVQYLRDRRGWRAEDGVDLREVCNAVEACLTPETWEIVIVRTMTPSQVEMKAKSMGLSIRATKDEVICELIHRNLDNLIGGW